MKTKQTQANNLASEISFKNKLYLKREDKHPLQSHKGRSIPLMIDNYIKEGFYNFVISSSGNAGIASALHISTLNKKSSKKITLTIFIGKKINKEKSAIIKKISNKKDIILKQTERPKQRAFLLGKEKNIQLLRQSTDDYALIGYEELAKELSLIKNLSAIFVPTSSGTTAVGLNRAFKKLNKKIQIHIVQTTSCHPFINFKNTKKEISLAGAIVDNIAHRKNEIKEVIKKSHGNGWVVNNKEIKFAIKLVEKTEKIKISPNSALSVAGLIKATNTNWDFKGDVVCVLTGK